VNETIVLSIAAIGVLDSTVIPIPAAAWLFGSALGLLGLARRRFS